MILNSFDSSKNEKENDGATEHVPSLLHLLPKQSPFPIASRHLREFLGLVEQNKLNSVTLIGMGPRDLVPTLRMSIHRSLSVESANLRILLMREALEAQVRDLLIPLKPR